MNARQRPIFIAVIAVVAVWLVALGGFALARHSKMTAEKVRAYLQATDLSKLSGDARAKALRELAEKLNSLSPEERQHARAEQLWARWFEQMSEQEKSDFIEATMPAGFKQMLASFEKLAPEKRKKTIDNAVKRLQEARESPAPLTGKTNSVWARGTNGPVLSEDLQKKVAVIGLKSVYSDSSAQSKAELAPLLEEIQKNMEAGRMFRKNE